MLIDQKKFRLSSLVTQPNTAKGRFIVFEGGNGVGKSTLLKKVALHITDNLKQEVVLTREPGATPLGIAIRSLVKEQTDIAIDSVAELLLFCADRAQHVQTVIKPALARGAWVLSDRYYFSTLAFQGWGRGISRDIIDRAVSLAIQGLKPDLTVIVDLSIEAAKARMAVRGQSVNEVDRFEDEADKFQERVREGFLQLARESEESCVILDGSKSPEALKQELLSLLMS